VARRSDPAVRIALIEAAARLIDEEGSASLTARRLAAEVGASTTAVYTHFGGMEALRRTLRIEGFKRLAGYMSEVRRTQDPIADLAALGAAYCRNGLANPHLYRVMFLETPLDEADGAVGLESFEVVASTVERSVAAGRIRHTDPWALAIQVWLICHGMVAAVLADMLSPTDLVTYLSETSCSLLTGLGDDSHAAKRSVAKGLASLDSTALGDAVRGPVSGPAAPRRHVAPAPTTA
jgi:AcrR family transcriptional regulator